jgi:hypothetical protein
MMPGFAAGVASARLAASIGGSALSRYLGNGNIHPGAKASTRTPLRGNRFGATTSA